MTVSLAGSGVATSCAAGLLQEFAQHVSDERREYILAVREELCAEFKYLVAERDRARESAIAFAEGKLVDSAGCGRGEYPAA